jgi:hypothetical protein
MKIKEHLEVKNLSPEQQITVDSKPRSLRPMRSLLSSRSWKPKSKVAMTMTTPKTTEFTERN